MGTYNSLPNHAPPSTSRALRINAITRLCSLSYFRSSRRTSANNLLLTAVRGHGLGLVFQRNHVCLGLGFLVYFNQVPERSVL